MSGVVAVVTRFTGLIYTRVQTQKAQLAQTC